MPLYAQTLMGYTAVWAGYVLGPGGIASLFIMPVAGALMRKGVSSRLLLAIGLATMAYALWLMSGLNLEANFFGIAWPRIVQGFGIGLFFVPLAASTYVNIPREEMGNASGIFNLLRTLGGSFGVAVSSSLLSQRAQVHQTFLVEHVTPFSTALRDYAMKILQLLPGQGQSPEQSTMLLAGIYREVLRQANMLAFNDIFGKHRVESLLLLGVEVQLLDQSLAELRERAAGGRLAGGLVAGVRLRRLAARRYAPKTWVPRC